MSQTFLRRGVAAGTLGVIATLSACADPSAPSTAPRAPGASFAVPAYPNPDPYVTTRYANPEYFEVCKDYAEGSGPDVTINITVDVLADGSAANDPTLAPITLASGACRDVWVTGAPGDIVTVTEVVPAGYTASYVKTSVVSGVRTTFASVASNTASGLVKGNTGQLVIFTNTLIPPSGELGNFVWVDTNKDGIQDAGEPGIPGVTVTLSGAASATTTTDANGLYLFSGLSAGSYTVTVATPTGYQATSSNAAGSTTANDSDGSPASATLATNSSSDLTIDFGFYLIPPPPTGGQGCTPGYWKQEQHFGSWTGYTRNQLVNTVFGVTYVPTLSKNQTYNGTLLAALGLGGGGYNALMRHAVAALLNASSGSGVDYLYTTAEVIAKVQAAFADPSLVDQTHNEFSTQNELGCPLGRSP